MQNELMLLCIYDHVHSQPYLFLNQWLCIISEKKKKGAQFFVWSPHFNIKEYIAVKNYNISFISQISYDIHLLCQRSIWYSACLIYEVEGSYIYQQYCYQLWLTFLE